MVGLVYWSRASWGKAAVLMAVGLAGELVIAAMVTSLLGISTPGS